MLSTAKVGIFRYGASVEAENFCKLPSNAVRNKAKQGDLRPFFFFRAITCTGKGAKIEQRAEKAAKTGFYSLVVVPAFVVGWVPAEFYRGSLGYSGKGGYRLAIPGLLIVCGNCGKPFLTCRKIRFLYTPKIPEIRLFYSVGKVGKLPFLTCPKTPETLFNALGKFGK